MAWLTYTSEKLRVILRENERRQEERRGVREGRVAYDE